MADVGPGVHQWQPGDRDVIAADVATGGVDPRSEYRGDASTLGMIVRKPRNGSTMHKERWRGRINSPEHAILLLEPSFRIVKKGLTSSDYSARSR
jgi:hypothetical protein